MIPAAVAESWRAQRPGGPQIAGCLDLLTPAERLVAIHLVQGLSNKEIACLLGKAEPTVKHHVSAILLSSGAGSRSRFIAAYYRQIVCPLGERLEPDRASRRDDDAKPTLENAR